MAPLATHDAHDRLMATIVLAEKRLIHLGEQVGALDDESGQALEPQIAELRERCDHLRAEVASWAEVEIGMPSAIDDLVAETDALEADVDSLREETAAGYEVAVDRQIRVWRAQMDRLRVQGALGAMEARDDVDQLLQRVDHVRGAALVELQQALDDSKELVADLRDDVEEVLADVRNLVRRASREVTKRP